MWLRWDLATQICVLRKTVLHTENRSERDITVKIQDRIGRRDIGVAEVGNMKHFIIYKITNLINNRYYIGRHSTNNLDDGYLGSGKGIINAVKRYGKENFKKEILVEASSSEELWELEKIIVDAKIVDDPLSYNMSFGGRSYLDGLKKYDIEKFKQHQSSAGKIGGKNSFKKKSLEELRKWHSDGGKSNAKKQKILMTHPFYNGVAAILGGTAVKGMIELWNPKSTVSNKNQKDYKTGDCKKAKFDSKKFKELTDAGWLTIDEHKKNLLFM